MKKLILIFIAALMLTPGAFALDIDAADLRDEAVVVTVAEIIEGNEVRRLNTLSPEDLVCVSEQVKIFKKALQVKENIAILRKFKGVDAVEISLLMPRTPEALSNAQSGIYVDGRYLGLIVYMSHLGCHLLTLNDFEREFIKIEMKAKADRIKTEKDVGDQIQVLKTDAVEILKKIK